MRTFYIFLFCFIIVSCNDNDTEKQIIVDKDTITKTDVVVPEPDVRKDTVIAVVKKQPRASDNEHWKKKKAEGVDFMVIGNEPFWNLEIRNSQSLRFHLSDWEQPVNITFSGNVEKGKFNELGAKDIEVRIVPQECSDGMSDFWYDYSVTVTYKGVIYKGCGIAL